MSLGDAIAVRGLPDQASSRSEPWAEANRAGQLFFSTEHVRGFHGAALRKSLTKAKSFERIQNGHDRLVGCHGGNSTAMGEIDLCVGIRSTGET